MRKIVLLDAATLGSDLTFETLAPLGELTVYEQTDATTLIERIRDAEVILINKVRLTADVLSQAQCLKLICIFATGFDNVDLSFAQSHGIAVTNVPAYSTESVALLTVSTALALVTHLFEYTEFVRSGAYSAQNCANRLTPVYHELAEKTWGIVGAGHIGTRVGEIAAALGARVLVHQRHAHGKFPTVDMDTLCRESDVLTLHCPLNEGTRHIINERRLHMMKPSSVLVNVARGAVVDESAVACAIEEKRLGAFGSDVYSTEPFGENHPFYRIKEYPNVLLTPHTAWGAYEARVRCLKNVVENIRAFDRGERRNRVD